jgi:hypothetical protein
MKIIDFTPVSKLIAKGELKEAKDMLVNILAEIKESNYVMSGYFRRKLLMITHELQALSLLEETVKKNPKKVQDWLNKTPVEQEITDESFGDLEALLNASLN